MEWVDMWTYTDNTTEYLDWGQITQVTDLGWLTINQSGPQTGLTERLSFIFWVVKLHNETQEE